MAGLKKLGLPKFNPPKFASGTQKTSPAASNSKPAAASHAPKADGLSSFKNALSSGQIKSNLNQPALPQTAAKTQKFGGWIG